MKRAIWKSTEKKEISCTQEKKKRKKKKTNKERKKENASET